ncbi:hypothetical protein GRI75_04005 [Altererythrobacter soli]|uniref:Lipoprotein n=1 Tax=Croceibacterium soli TaxID=1739690 RepID=A0A6I4UPF9_9SPHN|nr:hypothetical protein [Croceibacterium soli]MXP40811.1 hypothetical protein [Croceibacterium soli]
MRILTLATLTAGLALVGCSERTQDNAEEMVESAAADAAANTEQVLEEGAEAAGNAAENLDQEAAEAEADVQNEPTAEAQVD